MIFQFLHSTFYLWIKTMLTARCIHEWRLHVTILLRYAMIDAVGHIFELPIAIVPTTLVHHVLRGVRAHWNSRTFELSPVFVHFDRPFLPSLLLSCWQFPPLKRKFVLHVSRGPFLSCYQLSVWRTVGETILFLYKNDIYIKWFDKLFTRLCGYSLPLFHKKTR